MYAQSGQQQDPRQDQQAPGRLWTVNAVQVGADLHRVAHLTDGFLHSLFFRQTVFDQSVVLVPQMGLNFALHDRPARFQRSCSQTSAA